MKTIASFTIDHIRLQPGLYVSRADAVGDEAITTFDVRLTAPNREPVLSTGVMHAIEHIGATYLRNDSPLADKVIYWGPMGCRTGFYAIFAGAMTPTDAAASIKGVFTAVVNHEGPIPGASPEACGNYSDMDLDGAKAISRRYLDTVLACLGPANTEYPN